MGMRTFSGMLAVVILAGCGEAAPPAMTAADHYQAGRDLEQRRQYGEALDHYEAAFEQNPQAANFAASMGNIYLRSGRAGEAEAQFLKAVELDPERAAFRFFLGMCYLELRREEEAVAAFEEALTLKEDYPLAHEKMAVAYWRLKRHDEAEAHLEKAIEYGGEPDPAFVEVLNDALKKGAYKETREDGEESHGVSSAGR